MSSNQAIALVLLQQWFGCVVLLVHIKLVWVWFHETQWHLAQAIGSYLLFHTHTDEKKAHG